jgi:hypothetical protein
VTPERSVDLIDVMVAVLRKTPGRVTSAFPSISPLLREMRLV